MKTNIRGIVSLVVLGLNTMGADAWEQWRGPNGDGVVEGFVAPDSWPKQLEMIWRVDLGGGDGSPVVAGGRVYVHSRRGDQEVVSKLDTGTGDLIWQDRYGPISYVWPWPGAESRGKGPFSTPSIAGGRLFTFGVTQTLSAYDAESGEVLWRVAFDKTLGFGSPTSPIVVDDLCIVHVGEPKAGALTAFDVATGEVRWRSDYDTPSYASPFLTTLYGVRQLIVLSSKYLSGIVPETGEILWKADTPHPFNENISTPVQIGSTFIVSAIGQGTKAFLVERDADIWTASQIWHNDLLATYTNSPIVVNDLVYGFANQRKGHFFALDPENGEVIWKSPGRQGEHASLISMGDMVLSLKGDGELEVYRAELIAEYAVANTTTWAHPVVLRDRLLVKDARGLSLWSMTAGHQVEDVSEAEPTPGPGPHEVVTRAWEKDGTEMVLIPGGPFRMGKHYGRPGRISCPHGRRRQLLHRPI